MRIQHRYLCYHNAHKLVKPLDAAGIKYSLRERQYAGSDPSVIIEFLLYEDQPDFTAKSAVARRLGLEPQIGTEYDKKDIAGAEWFWLSTGGSQYPQPEEGFGYLNASFDLSDYCATCGVGAVQNAPIRLSADPKPIKYQILGIEWLLDVVFVREEAKVLLEKEDVKGIAFMPVVLHRSGKPVEGISQLQINTVLPQGFNSTNATQLFCNAHNEENSGKDVTTNYCGRLKNHFPRVGGLRFERAIFEGQPDIVLTHEYFGSGASACRLPVVSKKMKLFFESSRFKGLKFTPLFH